MRPVSLRRGREGWGNVPDSRGKEGPLLSECCPELFHALRLVAVDPSDELSLLIPLLLCIGPNAANGMREWADGCHAGGSR